MGSVYRVDPSTHGEDWRRAFITALNGFASNALVVDALKDSKKLSVCAALAADEAVEQMRKRGL